VALGVGVADLDGVTEGVADLRSAIVGAGEVDDGETGGMSVGVGETFGSAHPATINPTSAREAKRITFIVIPSASPPATA